jgi:hypothetical protein
VEPPGDVDFLAGKASEYLKDYIDANPASGIPPVDFKAVMTALGSTRSMASRCPRRTLAASTAQ